MINYSIIIPHKDVPELLQRCLDSIPVRDDVEVIVVDDNSAPEKVDFGHFPEWNGEHYHVFLTKEGKGAGYARNVGLPYAMGRWLIFVDADDFFLPTINQLLDDEIDTDTDIVFFRPQAVKSDDISIISHRADKYNTFIDNWLRTDNERELRCRWFPAWSKFIKRKMVCENGIVFEETCYSNDIVFSTQIGCEAGTIKVREDSFYVVTEREGSLTSHFLSKPGELEMVAGAFFRAQNIIHEKGYLINCDEGRILDYLRRLYFSNSHVFIHCFNSLVEMGVISRISLLNKVFKTTKNSKTRFKCKVRALAMTLFGKNNLYNS